MMKNRSGSILSIKQTKFTQTQIENGDHDIHIKMQGDFSKFRETQFELKQKGPNFLNQENYKKLTPLHYAMENPKITIEILKTLHEFGADFSARTISGETPLHYLCKNPVINKYLINNIYFSLCPVKHLKKKDYNGVTPYHLLFSNTSFTYDMLVGLDKKCPVTKHKTNNGETFLHYCYKIPNPKQDIVKFLLDKQFDINFQNKNGETPFHLACSQSQTSIETIDFLLKNGVKINIKNSNGESPFLYACKNLSEVSLKYLVENGKPDLNEINNKNECCLHKIALRIYPKDTVFKYFLEKKCDPNAKTSTNDTPLHYLCSNQKSALSDAFSALIDNGADINSLNINGDTPIMNLLRIFKPYDDIKASTNKIINPVDLLLSKKARLDFINANGETPLHIALEFSDHSIIRKIIKDFPIQQYANQSQSFVHSLLRHKSPFSMSQRTKNDHSYEYEFIEFLFKKKISTVSKTGESFLHIAIENSIIPDDVIELLLKYGNDPNKKNQKKETPLHIACKQGRLDILKLLIAYFGDPEAETSRGENILHYACYCPLVNVNILKYIIEDLKIDVNSLTNQKLTPLQCLCCFSYDSIDAAEYLISKGANIEQLTKENENLLHLSLLNSAITSKFLDYLINKLSDFLTEVNNKGEIPLFYAIYSTLSLYIFDLSVYTNTDVQIKNKHQEYKLNTKDQTSMLHAAVNNSNITLEKLYFILKKSKDINSKNSQGDTPLSLAIKKRKTNIAMLLLRNKADPNTNDLNGDTPLMFSVRSDKIEMIKMLLKFKADPNILNNDSEFSLLLAVKSSNKKALEILLDNNARMDVFDKNGNTAFHVACSLNNMEIIKIFVEKGINVNILNKKRETALHIASKKGNLDLVKYLIQNNAVLGLGVSVIPYACESNSIDLVKYLVSIGANINEQKENGSTALHYCCKDPTKIQIVEFILNEGVDINLTTKKNKTAIYFACKYKNEEAIKLLISKNADINIKDHLNRSPFYYACMNCSEYIVETLISQVDNINEMVLNKKNQYISSPLHVVSQRGSVDLIDLLITHGANPNLMNAEGEIPFLFACKSSSFDAMTYYLKRGADINETDNNGNTPLLNVLSTSFEGFLPLMFISQGANLFSRNSEGKTPLHLACLRGHVETFDILLEKGANVNDVDYNNETPLLLACSSFIEEGDVIYSIIEKLLQHHADPNINPIHNDKISQTLMHIAIMRQSTKLIQLLFNNGADLNTPDFEGKIPFHVAVFQCAPNIIELLIKLGAKQKLKTNSGDTILHLFLYNRNKGHETILPKLFHKSLINEKNNNGETPLHIACKNALEYDALYLISKGSNVNAVDNKGLTPLHYLCMTDDSSYNEQSGSPSVNILNKLIECGADINALSFMKETPLHFACQHNFNLVDSLLNKGANVYLYDIHSNTIYHYLTSGYKDPFIIISQIINQNRKINITNSNGETPLLLAIKKNYVDVARLFINAGANVNAVDFKTNGYTPLHYACIKGDKKLINDILDKHPLINKCTPTLGGDKNPKYNCTPLHIACQYLIDESIIATLLKNKADPNIVRGDGKTAIEILYDLKAFNYMPMLIAAGAKHTAYGMSLLKIGIENLDVPLVHELLQTKENPNEPIDNFYPIHIAASMNSEKVIQELIRYHANIEQLLEIEGHPPTALMIACSRNLPNIVSVLLESKANPTRKINNKTALLYSIDANSTQCIELLLKYGASPNEVIDDDGMTILSYASKVGFYDGVKTLLNYKADINKCTTGHWNHETDEFIGAYLYPIHYAAKYGHTEVLQLLLENGADVNSKTFEDFLPIHFAAMSESIKAFELLHKKGSSLSASTFTLETPLLIALQHKNSDIIKYILNNANYIEKEELLSSVAKICSEDVVNLLIENLDEEWNTNFVFIALKYINDKQRIEFIKNVLENEKINLNIPGENGDFPIHIVTRAKSIILLELLISRGARATVFNKNRETPFDIARKIDWYYGMDALKTQQNKANKFHTRNTELKSYSSRRAVSEFVLPSNED